VNDGLPVTEAADPRTASIDRLEPRALAALLAGAHRAAVDAAAGAAVEIGRAIETVVAALESGGKVVQIGAGTSGRLAILDASELPPTFGLDPALVEGRIAGGEVALRRAIEGAEDDEAAGRACVADLGPRDCAIGLSASGGAPFVRAAVRAARAAGAATIAIVNSPDAPLCGDAVVAIVLATGPEPIAGSTRLVAGTAQKIALNTISTGAMIRLGKTYRNRMVDLVATNAKLRARAERLVREFGGDGVDAPAVLAAAGGRVKTAIVMARLGCDRASAEARLAAVHGRLAAVIDRG
jgi:N-acetylmuramic acid 6-phosphate etherase